MPKGPSHIGKHPLRTLFLRAVFRFSAPFAGASFKVRIFGSGGFAGVPSEKSEAVCENHAGVLSHQLCNGRRYDRTDVFHRGMGRYPEQLHLPRRYGIFVHFAGMHLDVSDLQPVFRIHERKADEGTYLCRCEDYHGGQRSEGKGNGGYR